MDLGASNVKYTLATTDASHTRWLATCKDSGLQQPRPLLCEYSMLECGSKSDIRDEKQRLSKGDREFSNFYFVAQGLPSLLFLL